MKSLFLEKFKQRISVVGKEGVFSLFLNNKQQETLNERHDQAEKKTTSSSNHEKSSIRSKKPYLQSEAYLLPQISEKSKKGFFEYSPYSVNDYRRISKEFPLINKNGLGGFIGSEEWEKRRGKKEKLNEYGKGIVISRRLKTKELNEEIEKRKENEKEKSKRMKGLMYSKQILKIGN